MFVIIPCFSVCFRGQLDVNRDVILKRHFTLIVAFIELFLVITLRVDIAIMSVWAPACASWIREIVRRVLEDLLRSETLNVGG